MSYTLKERDDYKLTSFRKELYTEFKFCNKYCRLFEKFQDGTLTQLYTSLNLPQLRIGNNPEKIPLTSTW